MIIRAVVQEGRMERMLHTARCVISEHCEIERWAMHDVLHYICLTISSHILYNIDAHTISPCCCSLIRIGIRPSERWQSEGAVALLGEVSLFLMVGPAWSHMGPAYLFPATRRVRGPDKPVLRRRSNGEKFQP